MMRGSLYSGGDFPFQIAGNRTWTGFQTFLGAAGQSNPTAEFKAASGQTGNLLEFYNAAGTRVAYFDQAGNFTTTGASTQFASSAVVQGSDTAIGFQVKRASGTATADLQQWQDQNGNVLLRVTAAGNLQSGSGAFSVNSLGIGVTSPAGALEVATAAAATGAHATVSIGAGPWDGTSAGFFAGSGRGTLLGLNAASTFSGDLANFQVAGGSKFKLDAGGGMTVAGNTTLNSSLFLPSSGAYLDFQGTLTNTPQSGSLSGYRIRLSGSNNNYNDYGIGIASSELWLNTTNGGHFSFYAGGAQVGILQNPGTTERSASANLILERPSKTTQVQGISFAGGPAYDAAILRTPNDDTLRFGFDSGGAFTERLLLNASGLLTVDPSGSNNGTAGGAGVWFGGASSEGISSSRSGSNLDGLNFWTNSAVRLAVHNTGVVYIGGNSTAATLAVRPDSTNSNPGSGAWVRSDNVGGLILDPNGTGQLYFAWGQANASHFGGTLEVKGLLSAVAGLTVSGAALTASAGLAVSGGTLSTAAGIGATINGAFAAAAGATLGGGNINIQSTMYFTNQQEFTSGITDANRAIRIYVDGNPYWLKLYQ